MSAERNPKKENCRDVVKQECKQVPKQKGAPMSLEDQETPNSSQCYIAYTQKNS